MRMSRTMRVAQSFKKSARSNAWNLRGSEMPDAASTIGPIPFYPNLKLIFERVTSCLVFTYFEMRHPAPQDTFGRISSLPGDRRRGRDLPRPTGDSQDACTRLIPFMYALSKRSEPVVCGARSSGVHSTTPYPSRPIQTLLHRVGEQTGPLARICPSPQPAINPHH